MRGLDKKKLTIVAALCAAAIAFALYMGARTFTQPKLAYPPGFEKYGPMGAPGSRPASPGTTPGAPH